MNGMMQLDIFGKEHYARKTGYKMGRNIGYLGDKFSPLCYQRSLRDSFETARRLPLDGSQVRIVDYRTARDFILQYEWLGTMGTTSLSVGLWCDDTLSGVVCFGVTAGSSAFAEPFGKDNASKGWVLVRGACAPFAHEHAATYLLARALPIVRQHGKWFIIAYSDPEAGEIGTVYQASNWKFYGMTSAVEYLVRPDGKRVDPRMVSKYAKKHGITRREQLDRFKRDGYTFSKGSPKLKYLCHTGNRREKAQLEKSRRVVYYPYLKRRDDMRTIYADFEAMKSAVAR